MFAIFNPSWQDRTDHHTAAFVVAHPCFLELAGRNRHGVNSTALTLACPTHPMSVIQPPASEKSELPQSSPRERYPFAHVALALIIGFGLCTVGFLRLAEMADSMVYVDETYAIPPFAAGLYFLLLAVVSSAMHPRPPAPRLPLPRILLLAGVPACTCIATAIVYNFTHSYDHVVLGFWDSLSVDGMYVWNMLALHAVWLIALCIFAWALPVTRHRMKSRRSTLADVAQTTASESAPEANSP